MEKRTGYEDILRESGLKATSQRCAVLSALERSEGPVSAEGVFSMLSGRPGAANLSTVYRTLESFTEKGIALRIVITGEERALFELNTEKHRHYLVCLACRKITPIEHCPLEEYEKKLAAATDYQIEGHRLDIYGYCPDCRGKSR